MSDYKPPFTVSEQAIKMVGVISSQIERYAIRLEQADGLRLRKANRIKTIWGSLAIEGNTLTESQVTDILEGKHIIAPLREIQEVKNAIKAYNAYPTLNPFSLKDMLKTHGMMMEALIDNPGSFRTRGVGVASGKRIVHIAPPPDRVPFLMKDLFGWIKKSQGHLLITSSVFHYEFEFIHPFADGNGRIGRLWQSLLLGKLHTAFEHLPIENMIFSHQQDYYIAIRKSTADADCGAFIDFMLARIWETLKQHQGEPLPTLNNVGINVGISVGINEKKALSLIAVHPRITAIEMAIKLNLSVRQVERLFSQLKKQNLIRRTGSRKTGHWELSARGGEQ